MLFSYKYVPHQMEKMQEFVDFIFHEVWCKAPAGLEFHTDLFHKQPDLSEVMIVFGFSPSAPKRGRAFYHDVKEIYNHFATLASEDIDQFKLWYKGNNEIEKVCANRRDTLLARYDEIAVKYSSLADLLSNFFKGLYSQSLLNLAALRKHIGTIDDHYEAFTKINNAGKCPFCGISDMLGVYHSKLEAYDHYLPKALYPFNAINFRNLVPACHHCNSSYKTVKDPAYIPKDPVKGFYRRKAFYPYKVSSHTIEIQVALQHIDLARLTPPDITLQLGPSALSKEIETWLDVYGIEERYRAKLCAENDGKFWVTQVIDEFGAGGRTPSQYLETLARQAKMFPFADCQFLKMAFLNAFHAAGGF